MQKYIFYKLRFFHSSPTSVISGGQEEKIIKRLSKNERSEFKLDLFIKQVLIGNILGDVYMRRYSNKANTRIVFRQGYNNSSYLLHLYDLFKTFVTRLFLWIKRQEKLSTI